MREILIKNYHSEQSKRLQYENPLPSLVEKLDNEYIDSILSLLSQRIKAKALTDEEIDEQGQGRGVGGGAVGSSSSAGQHPADKSRGKGKGKARQRPRW